LEEAKDLSWDRLILEATAVRQVKVERPTNFHIKHKNSTTMKLS
jgi:hypothetical protein